jgi:hypothetical protein
VWLEFITGIAFPGALMSSDVYYKSIKQRAIYALWFVEVQAIANVCFTAALIALRATVANICSAHYAHTSTSHCLLILSSWCVALTYCEASRAVITAAVTVVTTAVVVALARHLCVMSTAGVSSSNTLATVKTVQHCCAGACCRHCGQLLL